MFGPGSAQGQLRFIVADSEVSIKRDRPKMDGHVASLDVTGQSVRRPGRAS